MAPAGVAQYALNKSIVGKFLLSHAGQTKKEIMVGLGKLAVHGGLTFGGMRVWQNVIAKALEGYDPDRPITEGVMHDTGLGAIMGAAGGAAGEGTKAFRERITTKKLEEGATQLEGVEVPPVGELTPEEKAGFEHEAPPETKPPETKAAPPAEAAPVPGDLWYQGASKEGETNWVTHDINIAKEYASKRGPEARINVYTAEQVGKTAFENAKGELISPQEYAKDNWSTTLQTGAGKPKPIDSFPAAAPTTPTEAAPAATAAGAVKPGEFGKKGYTATEEVKPSLAMPEAPAGEDPGFRPEGAGVRGDRDGAHQGTPRATQARRE